MNGQVPHYEVGTGVSHTDSQGSGNWTRSVEHIPSFESTRNVSATAAAVTQGDSTAVLLNLLHCQPLTLDLSHVELH